MTCIHGQRFVVDRFTNVDAGATAKTLMGVINDIQHATPDTQLAACAVIFLLACDRFRVDPRNALEIASNLIGDRVGDYTEFRAAKMYMKQEW